jgi:predicted alpha-1,2-mannosidase
MRWLSVILLCACGPSLPDVARPIDYAEPRFGSGGWGYTAGSAFVGASVPAGLVKVGPDTSGKNGTLKFLHFDGYWASDDTIQGFSHLHLHGTGACDYGVLTLMPTDALDASRETPDGYGAKFSKKSEVSTPGYYAATLTQTGITAELTASTHVAHHRYSFGAAKTGVVVVDLAHHLCDGSISHAELVLSKADGRAHGQLHSLGGMSKGFGGVDVYFELLAKTPWTEQRVWSDGSPFAEGATASGTGVGAALQFDTSSGAAVELQVAVSFVSNDGAAANLASEAPAFDFDGARSKAADAWSHQLSAVKIAGGTEDERKVFYSALHHVFVMPGSATDVDGKYRGHDGQVHTADGFTYVSDLSLWDTYRTENPLVHLLAPSLGRDVVRSLHAMAQQGGVFPKWPLATGDTGSMIGDSAEVVLADAYAKGITDFDAEGAYQVMRGAALDATPPARGRGGRGGEEAYDAHGFVPASHGDGSVSLTTEFALDDFALANLADALGHADDAAHLRARMTGYRGLYDSASGFLRARNDDGSLAHPGTFDPLVLSDEYVEANAWHSLWAAPHDVDGLVTLLGGQDAFIARLTDFFQKSKDEYASLAPDSVLRNLPRPYYWHGNEPDIHAAYLFAQAGRPDLTQAWVRWAMDTWYAPGPDGLPGNDDGGTMSAWYVFSAMGLYPLPGSDRYILGAPRFPRVTLSVPGGTFTIEAPDVSSDKPYVVKVELNGRSLSAPELKQKDLKAGGTLRFTMGATPTSWGRR